MTQKENKEYEDMKTYWGTLVDIGINQYQIEWQRIGTMQQSAGALMSALSVLYSAVFVILTFKFKEMPDILSRIITTSISIDLIFIILSTTFLFRVIFSKNINTMPLPLEIEKQIEKADFAQMLYESLTLINTSIENLHQHVENNHKDYKKGVIASITSFIFTVLIILLVLINSVEWKYFEASYYVILIIIAVISIICIFFRRNKNE